MQEWVEGKVLKRARVYTVRGGGNGKRDGSLCVYYRNILKCNVVLGVVKLSPVTQVSSALYCSLGSKLAGTRIE